MKAMELNDYNIWKPRALSSHSLRGGSSMTICRWFSRRCGNELETLLREHNFGAYLSPRGGRRLVMVSLGSMGISSLSCKDGLSVTMVAAIRMCSPSKSPGL